jgi:DNA polymerase III psi subunit
MLIIVDDESVVVKVFLEKILKAVNLSLDEVELINQETLKHTEFKDITKGKSFERILSFGVPLVKLNRQADVRLFIKIQL